MKHQEIITEIRSLYEQIITEMQKLVGGKPRSETITPIDNTLSLSVNAADTFSSIYDLQKKVNELTVSIEDIRDIVVVEGIITGLDVTVSTEDESEIVIESGTGITTSKRAVTLDYDITLPISLPHAVGELYILLRNDNEVIIRDIEVTDALTLGKIIIQKSYAVRITDDYENGTDCYIYSAKEETFANDFKINDATKPVLRNFLNDLLASNLIGEIKLSEGLTLRNTRGTMQASSEEMTFYNNDGTELASYGGNEARVGNMIIEPNLIRSRNYNSGAAGFQLHQNGTINALQGYIGNIVLDNDGLHSSNYVANTSGFNLNQDGTITALEGSIAGWSITASKLYKNTINLDSANEKIYIGTGNYNNADTAFYVDSAGKFSLKDKLTFDGTNLTIDGTITAVAGIIGGFTIATNTITSNNLVLSSANDTIKLGSGNDIISLDAADAAYRLAIGHATYASAPFRVSKAGAVTAISGTIGGLTLASNSLTSGNLEIDSSAETIKLGSGNDIISLDSADATYRLAIGHATYASAPFSVTKAGAVAAISGAIGGFTLAANTLTSNNLVLSSADDTIKLGSGNDIISLDAADATYRLAIGHATYASAPFSITKAGLLKAESGTVGGWNLGASTLYSNIGGGDIIIDAANVKIESDNYLSGINGAGFHLSPNLLEVGNISARGLIRTAVFQQDAVNTMGANFAYLGGDVLASDMTALDAATLTIEGNDTFVNGDILRAKDGTDDEWFEVTDASGAPTYVVTRDKAGDYGVDSNPTWSTGTSITNYKQSGDGFVYITASESNAPYLSVHDHAGSPWSTINTRLRLGNLNGYLGYAADTYGIGIGDSSASKANLTFDVTNGLRFRIGTTDMFILDNAGNAIMTSVTLRTADSTDRVEMDTDSLAMYVSSVEKFRLGELNGFLDYTESTFGLGFGSSDADIANFTYDEINGLRLKVGTVDKFILDNSGNAYITSAHNIGEFKSHGIANLDGGFYSETSADISGTVSPLNAGYFKPDGSKVYLSSNTTVFQYSLTTPWDVSTLSYDSKSYSIGSTHYGLFFSADGAKMYKTNGNTTLTEYDLSTPWDVSTASSPATYDVSSETAHCWDINISSDGTKLFCTSTEASPNPIFIWQYTMSTPWDITSATYDDIVFKTTQTTNGLPATTFSTDGTRLLVYENVTDTVYRYDLDTAWDISSAYDSGYSLDVDFNTATGNGMQLDSESARLYIINDGTPHNIVVYDLRSPDLFVDSSTGNVGIKTDSPSTSSDMTLSNGVLAMDETTTPPEKYYAIERLIYNDVDYDFSNETAGASHMSVGDTLGQKIYITNGTAGDSIWQYNNSTAWDISTASYVNTYDPSAETSNAQATFVNFSNMYVLDGSTSIIYQYTLGAQWNIVTASYALKSYDASAEDNAPVDLFFKSDGTKMFLLGSQNNTVYRYTLATPWDISTASYDTNSKSLTAQSTSVSGFTFNSAGTKMYMVDNSATAQIRIYEYTMSGAFDLSTASATGVTGYVGRQATMPKSIAINPTFGAPSTPDGAIMFVMDYDTDTIYEYDISHDVGRGKIYTKSDNKLYFQAGNGTEYEIATV